MIILSTMYIIQKTKSTDELTVINTELIINEESDMKDEIISYIDLIDDSLIPHSNYTYTNTQKMVSVTKHMSIYPKIN